MDGVEDECDKHFLPPCPSDTGGCFVVPRVHPRVGDEYQAKIPPLMEEYTRLHLIWKSTDTEIIDDVSNSFLLGLPIPVMWPHHLVESIKQHSLEFCGSQADAVNKNGNSEPVRSKESQITSHILDAEMFIDRLEATLHENKDVGGSSNSQPTIGSDKMVIDKSKRCPPLPDSVAGSWSEIEHNSFVLGLYIFGKNFCLVKQFIESKKMGEILFFYYGDFYQSAAYRRWAECRKMKSKRSTRGPKIFSGWRQQELLSRLFSQVSEKCKNRLVEVLP